MERILTSEIRKHLTDAINRVHYGGERLILRRRNKDLAVLISMDDAEFLEAIEDHIDIEAAKEALEKGGKSILWKEAKRKLGL